VDTLPLVLCSFVDDDDIDDRCRQTPHAADQSADNEDNITVNPGHRDMALQLADTSWPIYWQVTK